MHLRQEPGRPGQGGIRVGVSACLLGQHVRYDGGHKKDSFVTGPLARFVDFVPVCPEVEAGFGTPKQTTMFYVWKIFYYSLFGLIVAASFTRGLEFNDIGGWWHEPILYQKLMVWTVLVEILGLAAELGVEIDDFIPVDANIERGHFHFGGRNYHTRDILQAFLPLAAHLQRDIALLTEIRDLLKQQRAS